jgi:hypothetical protein
MSGQEQENTDVGIASFVAMPNINANQRFQEDDQQWHYRVLLKSTPGWGLRVGRHQTWWMLVSAFGDTRYCICIDRDRIACSGLEFDLFDSRSSC